MPPHTRHRPRSTVWRYLALALVRLARSNDTPHWLTKPERRSRRKFGDIATPQLPAEADCNCARSKSQSMRLREPRRRTHEDRRHAFMRQEIYCAPHMPSHASTRMSRQRSGRHNQFLAFHYTVWNKGTTIFSKGTTFFRDVRIFRWSLFSYVAASSCAFKRPA